MTRMNENQLAHQIGQQYCDLLDNQRDQLSLYLSDDAVLRWFGRTISGKDLVTSFFNREIANTTHKLTNVEPADPIQIRSIRRKEVNSCPKSFRDCGSPQEKCIKSFRNLTVNDCVSSSCHNTENLAFSGDITMQHNDNTSGAEEDVQCYFDKCFKASGEIQFCRTRMSPSSRKNLKLATDTMKWERACKVHISYSFFQSQGEFRNFELKQIIYEDTTRCKRNLAPEFDKIARKWQS
ncbi:uncharacterized protein [Anabrus simplex]|uniref:uncharacterized protein n=1 Tax=Anabrus simplex TaxID=316456 RepID=UPI0034DDB477